MTLGEKIQELRNARKMSQEQVAELLGVSRQAVSKWETNQSRPHTANLICLAKLFHVSVEDLTSPDTKVTLIYDLNLELRRIRKHSKVWKSMTIALLLLFTAAFIAALYTRYNGYSETTVFLFACLAAFFVLFAFLPILIIILRFVYQDCKRRGIKPTFYVFISLSIAGLAYYLLRRDDLAASAKETQ